VSQPQSQQDYQGLGPKELALALAELLDGRQATDIAILDVSGPLVIADYFVIATARNPRHASGLAQEIDFALKRGGRLRRNLAGTDGETNWALLDFDDVVVHIFVAEAREFYALDQLWADVPRVEFIPGEHDAAPTSTAPRPAASPHVLQPQDSPPDDA